MPWVLYYIQVYDFTFVWKNFISEQRLCLCVLFLITRLSDPYFKFKLLFFQI